MANRVLRTNGRYNGMVRRPPQGWTATVPSSSAQAILKGRQASRGLAHRTTAGNVGGLNFRVRDGTGCIPAALAVKPLLEKREDGRYIRISFGGGLADQTKESEEHVPDEKSEVEAAEQRDPEGHLGRGPGAVDPLRPQSLKILRAIPASLREQDEDVLAAGVDFR